MLELVVEQLLRPLQNPVQQKRCTIIPFLMGQGVWIDSEKLGPQRCGAPRCSKHGTLSVSASSALPRRLKALTGKHHGESEETQEAGA